MKTIQTNYIHKIEIDSSIFICTLFKCQDELEAKKMIQTIASDYQDASHNCWCFITEDTMRSSDDGEPTGTAGVPMLETIKKNQLMNVGAVVTRYFGGIKLGAGGLIRAYSKSVSSTIKLSTIVDVVAMHLYRLTFDYEHIKKIELELNRFSILIQNKFFDELVSFYVLLSDPELVTKLSYLPFIEMASLGIEYKELGGDDFV